MATQVQHRRGTSAQNNAFTGAAGEITVDTTNNSVRIHDGSTAGGTRLLNDTLLASVAGNIIPAADNLYSLGNTTNRFSTLFLAGNTIVLGGLTLKDGGGTIQVLDNNQNIILNANTSSGTTGTNASFTGTITTVDMTVSGNLTVSGTTTTINTETINLADNLIVLNSNASGSPTEDAGLIVNRGSSANVSLFWDETNDRWSLNNSSATYIVHNTGRDVALGTETSGAYVANVLAGTGLTASGQGGESATPTLSLSTSGVSASTYGNATIVPVITVDTYGRITSASNTTISAGVSTGKSIAMSMIFGF